MSVERKNGKLLPPKRSNNVFTDLKYFIFSKPKTRTLVEAESGAERDLYCKSILQRTGVGVDEYSMLNIHRIGIDAPASYVFEELLKWNGDSSCWPNHIATVDLKDKGLEKIEILLFGKSKYPFGLKNGLFGIRFLHLFNLKAITIQDTPTPFDFDNARYLLYECSGGYPIGVFSMYVRSAIDERNEKEKSYLFMMVGFNFYGKKTRSKYNIMKFVWERIHNRVTANVANRFKQLCEWRFQNFVNG